MTVVKLALILFLFFSAIVVTVAPPASIGGTVASGPETEDYRSDFLNLIDWACEFLKTDEGQQAFLESYAVRGLSVCYDMTKDEKYFDACTTWADTVLLNQEKMIPSGAYYMNYGRKPGEKKGEWFVADSSSIAMGVLASRARSTDEAHRRRYIRSLKSFADLVIHNFVRKSGGITDGYWKKSDKEWWCSTALFGAFCFLLYDQTNETKYLDVGLNAIDWLLKFDYRNDATTPSFEKGAPSVLFYMLEAYCAGLPYLERGSDRRKEVLARFSEAVAWLTENQNENGSWNYKGWWGAKQPGLSLFLTIYETYFPRDKEVKKAGEKAFGFLQSMAIPKGIHKKSTTDKKLRISFQKAVFSMMSFAEKVSHRSIYSMHAP